jgi:hypothetical protein
MSTLETLKKGGFVQESEIKRFEVLVAENFGLRERLDKELQAWLSDYYKSSSSRLTDAFLTNILLLVSCILIKNLIV